MATNKKVTDVRATEAGKAATAKAQAEASSSGKQFTASAEAKAKAHTNRIIAIILWVLGIGCEAYAIVMLLGKLPLVMWQLYVALGVDLVLVIIGSILWKKANRLDPASKADAFRFFIQNQLGAIISIIAFLPVVILVFLNKDMDGKQKGIAGAVAIVCLLGATAMGIDFKPPSVEEYTTQINEVVELTGQDQVFWTKSGTRYHLFDDCQHINTDKTDEIFTGTVPQARELKNITELCQTCKSRWIKDHPEAGAADGATDESTGEPETEPATEPTEESATEPTEAPETEPAEEEADAA